MKKIAFLSLAFSMLVSCSSETKLMTPAPNPSSLPSPHQSVKPQDNSETVNASPSPSMPPVSSPVDTNHESVNAVPSPSVFPLRGKPLMDYSNGVLPENPISPSQYMEHSIQPGIIEVLLKDEYEIRISDDQENIFVESSSYPDAAEKLSDYLTSVNVLQAFDAAGDMTEAEVFADRENIIQNYDGNIPLRYSIQTYTFSKDTNLIPILQKLRSFPFVRVANLIYLSSPDDSGSFIGSVFDNEGQKLSGVTLKARIILSQPNTSYPSNYEVIAKTNSEGEYQISFPAGVKTYAVTASKTGYISTTQNIKPKHAGILDFGHSMPSKTISSSALRKISFTPVTESTPNTTLQFSGSVFDEQGLPVSGVKITKTATRFKTGYTDAKEKSEIVETNDKGFYTMSYSSEAEEYRVTASKVGYETVQQLIIPQNNGVLNFGSEPVFRVISSNFLRRIPLTH